MVVVVVVENDAIRLWSSSAETLRIIVRRHDSLTSRVASRRISYDRSRSHYALKSITITDHRYPYIVWIKPRVSIRESDSLRSTDCDSSNAVSVSYKIIQINPNEKKKNSDCN